MKKKTIISLSIVGVLATTVLSLLINDIVLAHQYKMELVAKSDDKIVADGTTAMQFKVKVSKNNKPIKNHNIYIYVSQGSLLSARQTSDEDGNIKFTYYPYLYINDKVSPLNNVKFSLQDESNSVVFTIPAKMSFELPSVKPDEFNTTSDWQGYDIL